MSNETRKDIESEIGKNGWRLVGKLGVVVGTIIIIPIVGGLIWVGGIDNQVNADETGMAALNRRVSATETVQATILERVNGIKNQLDYLVKRLDGDIDSQ